MSQPDTPSWTRKELVTLVLALEEFRDEYGPGEHQLAERVNAVLRGPGDRFVIVPYTPEGLGLEAGDPDAA